MTTESEAIGKAIVPQRAADIAPRDGAALTEEDLVLVLQSSLYPGASPSSIKLVLNYCRAAGLDPLQKPVHIVPMWDSKSRQMRDVILPGINLYRTQAARSGKFAGMSEPEFGPDITETIGGQRITYPEWCRVTVKRLLAGGTVAEFTAREFWVENYATKGGQEKSVAPNAMWTKRPRGQLAKCAAAQALRIAFPEVAGPPTADEMDGQSLFEADAIGGVAPPATVPPALPSYTQADFDRNLPAWTKLVADGKKTAPDLLATLSTRATFGEQQKATILSLKRAAQPIDDVVPKGAHDDFIAALDASDEGAQ